MDTSGARTYILNKLRNELPATRSYHCLEHTLDVYASAIDIAEREGVTGEDLVLLKMAALFHDSGFTEQDHEHEEAGCRIVRRELPGFGFTAEQVEAICGMIMSTRIPQSPKDQLGRILCDADLDYLGRPDFQRIGEMLFEELKAFGVLKDRLAWNRLQEEFLQGHRYFTETNRSAREAVKQQHLADVRAWLAAHG